MRIAGKVAKTVNFSAVKGNTAYLICNKGVSMLKEYNLHQYETYKDKFGHPEGKLREDKYIALKLNPQRKQTVLMANKPSEAAVYASFDLLKITAKQSKPSTDGEFVKECILKATEILCPEKQQLFKIISLSANTADDLTNYVVRDI
jgi:hypothetical protein